MVIDVEKFGNPARTNTDQLVVRAGMYQAVEEAFEDAGIGQSGYITEDRGDGALVLISPDVPKSWLVTGLPTRLAAALGRHNAACSVSTRMRLRMALHAGEVHPDAHGVTGNAVNKAFRLVDAPALKSALDNSAGVLALIVSDWLYDEVVRHEPAAGPRCYRRVRAVVKETRAAAWIRVLDSPAGGDSDQGTFRLTGIRVGISMSAALRSRDSALGSVSGAGSRRGSFRPARRGSWAANVK